MDWRLNGGRNCHLQNCTVTAKTITYERKIKRNYFFIFVYLYIFKNESKGKIVKEKMENQWKNTIIIFMFYDWLKWQQIYIFFL